MTTPERPWRLQSKQFGTRLYDAVTSYMYWVLGPEGKKRRDDSKVLAGYTYDDPKNKARNMQAVSIVVPNLYGAAQQQATTDWLLTFAYDGLHTLIGFRSMLITQNAADVTAKGVIATAREGFSTAIDTINARSMQHYTNALGRPVSQVVTDDNLVALQNIEWEYRNGLVDKEAYDQALAQRKPWLALYGEGGTMGVHNGHIEYTPQRTQQERTHYYQVGRGRMLRRRFRFQERQPTDSEASSLNRVGIELNAAQSPINFSRLVGSLPLAQ